MFKWVVLFLNSKWCVPKLFKRPKGESQNEITKEEKSWGTFFDSQHFEDKKMCWSSRIRLKWTHKWELKMRSTYTTKKRKQLVQVE